MNILFVAHYPYLYGANLSLLNLIDGLRQRHGIKCSVLAPQQGPFTQRLSEMGVPYNIVPFHNWIHEQGPFTTRDALYKLRSNVAKAWKMRGYIKQQGFNIVYSNSSATAFGSLLAMFSGTKHVWHIREFLLDDYNYHFDLPTTFVKWQFNAAAAIVSISRALTKLNHIKSHNNLHIVPNGVYWQAQVGRARPFPGHGKPVKLGIVGLVDEIKKTLEAVEALHILHGQQPNRWQLHVIGDGIPEYTYKIEKYINDNKLQDLIHLDGYVDNKNVYDNIDVLVLCSRNEAFGRVIVEAMANGVPVICYNGGGVQEIISHGHNGMLYSLGAEDLAKQANALVADALLWRKITENAIGDVRNKYTVEAYADAIHKVISDVDRGT